MNRLIVIFSCFLLLAQTVLAQEAADSVGRYAAFEKEYEAMMKSLNIVGVSMAVVKDNEIIYTHAFGKKDRSTGEPLDTADIFRVASISKPVLATAIMQLDDAGMLDITDDASNYLPFEIRHPKYPDTPITLEMIMSHTAGLNDSQGASNLNAANREVNGSKVARSFNGYAPGNGFQYCNYDATLLAAAIETVTGTPWHQYVRENVLEPLEVDGSFSVDDLDRSRFATLYSWNGGSYQARPDAYVRPKALDNYRIGVDIPALSPAGGLKITAPSLAKFMLMHMNYGESPLTDYRIISEESSRRMQKVLTDSVQYAIGARQRAGLGLMRTDEFVKGVELIGHIGIAFGVRCGMYFDPEKKFGFVIICSGTTTPAIVNKSIAMMYRHFIKEE